MSFTPKSLDEFLEQWGDELGKEADRAMAPLHVPSRDPVDWLPVLKRKLFPGQAHAVAAGAKTLRRQSSVGFIWEMGCGKTIGATAVVQAHASMPPPRRWHAKNPAEAPDTFTLSKPAYRAIVMCPGHLPKKWKREIESTIPGVKVVILESIRDVLALAKVTAPPAGPEWWIIGKDRAKLSCGWKPVVRVVKDYRVTDTLIRGGKRVTRVTYRENGKERRRFVEHAGASLYVDVAVLCPACGAMQRNRHQKPESVDHFIKDRRRCPCGNFLWQDIRDPDRYSPALFIKKKMKGFFNYLIVDEQQDMKGVDTVQGDAMGFLSAAVKKTITLTGTLIGGYAWHTRATLFRVGAAQTLIDMGLGWSDVTPFNERYGRIETKITTKGESDGDGHKMARGGRKAGRSVTKTVRPGCMPTLFGDHLASTNIFLSLDEVCADLPPFLEEIVPVEMDADLADEYTRIECCLRTAVKALMFKPGGRRMLSIMLQALLAYPDYPFKWKEIGYHIEEEGDELWVPVVEPKHFDEKRTYAKEKALLDLVKSEVAQGRKCWVFTTMVETRDAISRLEQMLNKDGIRSKTLRASVSPATREDWIEKEGPLNQVILSHPELVKTGLDFFGGDGKYNFPTIIFYMTGYNSFTLSQAGRRAWRIGQKLPCKTYYLFAKGTMQEQAMALMAKKMAATAAVSGRFSTEGLAAMAGEDDNIEMAMAKALIEATGKDGEALRAWDKIIARPVSVPIINTLPAAEELFAPTPLASIQPDLFSLYDDLGTLEG